MVDLTREDVARFLAAWRRAYLPTALLTPAVTKTVAALEELASKGGMVFIPDDAPTVPLSPPAAAPSTIAPDDDIPF